MSKFYMQSDQWVCDVETVNSLLIVQRLNYISQLCYYIGSILYSNRENAVVADSTRGATAASQLPSNFRALQQAVKRSLRHSTFALLLGLVSREAPSCGAAMRGRNRVESLTEPAISADHVHVETFFIAFYREFLCLRAQGYFRTTENFGRIQQATLCCIFQKILLSSKYAILSKCHCNFAKPLNVLKKLGWIL